MALPWQAETISKIMHNLDKLEKTKTRKADIGSGQCGPDMENSSPQKLFWENKVWCGLGDKRKLEGNTMDSIGNSSVHSRKKLGVRLFAASLMDRGNLPDLRQRKSMSGKKIPRSQGNLYTYLTNT